MNAIWRIHKDFKLVLMKNRNWCHCELYVYFRKYVLVLADLFSFLHLFLSLRFKTNTQIFWRVFFRSYNTDVFFSVKIIHSEEIHKYILEDIFMKIFWRILIKIVWRIYVIVHCTWRYFSVYLLSILRVAIKNTHKEILKIFFSEAV